MTVFIGRRHASRAASRKNNLYCQPRIRKMRMPAQACKSQRQLEPEREPNRQKPVNCAREPIAKSVSLSATSVGHRERCGSLFSLTGRGQVALFLSVGGSHRQEARFFDLEVRRQEAHRFLTRGSRLEALSGQVIKLVAKARVIG